MHKLISKMNNGRVKVITGIRRCGKSYLLFDLFVNYLHTLDVGDEQIISFALDEISSAKYRNPLELDSYIRGQIRDSQKKYYILLDEIQFVATINNPYVPDDDAKLGFIDVVLGLIRLKNVDLYVTGSNSRMLSSDILTQFRDRADEIRVFPLSFSEFLECFQGDKRDAWNEYFTYGGMPYVQSLTTHEEKSRYLQDLFERTYLKDVIERYQIRNSIGILNDLLNIVAFGIGSLTNPLKLANTFLSEKKIRITSGTIELYLNYFVDAFLLYKAHRYDVKGRKYMQTPLKYYFTDVGLRNACLEFRQQEETHIMENVLYCELIRRGYDVDVGVVIQNVVDDNGKKQRRQLEVDFVVNHANERFYIQSAFSIADEAKKEQEIASLIRIADSFRKIVIQREYIRPWRDEHGILYIGLEQFLLDEDAIRL